MRVEIDLNGTIKKFNSNNNLHSFDGKPARIEPDGQLLWCDDGEWYKIQFADGSVVLIKEPESIENDS